MKKNRKKLYFEYKRGPFEECITINDITKKMAKIYLSSTIRKQRKYADNFSAAAYSFIMNYKNKKRKKIEKIEKVKSTWEKKEASLKDALYLLNKTFLINKDVKNRAYHTEYSNTCFRCGCPEEQEESYNYICPAHERQSCTFERTTVDYEIRDKEYSRKTANIISIIKMIKDNHLPIKYGKND